MAQNQNESKLEEQKIVLDFFVSNGKKMFV